MTYLGADGNPMPNGIEVTWAAFPSDRLSFVDGDKTRTSGGKGIATNHVIGSSGDAIADAVISTRAYNPTTGTPDHGALPLGFKPKPVLVGILVDKAYASGPPLGHKISAKDPTQTIKGQVQVLGAAESQKVTLSTDPTTAAVSMYDAATFQPIKDWSVTTDASTGQASFLLSSTNYTFFSLVATWDDDPAASSALVIAGNTGYGRVVPPPTVPALQNGTLPIPSTRPAPTFQVFIPTGNTVTKGDKVALLLNSHVVWEGTADPNVPVEVAYAALNLASNNMLSYTTQTLQQSVPAAGANGFPTSGGPPQTLPDTGGIGPTLPAPRVVVKNAPTVGPGDILDQGLEIDVPPYGAAVGDLVTVYCYLSGKDVLTGMQANNIVPLIYSVREGSPLISGNKVPVYLPQWAVAGYALGQPPIVNFLQVDYKVVSQTRQPSPRWSSLSPTFTLNTTI